VVTAVRKLILPGISTAVMFVMLLGLGIWQVQRLGWKEGILAQIDAAEARPGVPLQGEPDIFTKVRAVGTLRGDLVAHYGLEQRIVPRQGEQIGSQMIVPMERAGADPVLVDLGWVPQSAHEALPMPDHIDGFIRPGDSPGTFSPAPDFVRNQFFTLEPAVIGRALGLAHVAPFVLVAMGRTPAIGYPDPAQNLPRPANNHLIYAITWFSLAGILAVTFGLFCKKVLRP
jgi:surfeit locus 1 family protein